MLDDRGLGQRSIPISEVPPNPSILRESSATCHRARKTLGRCHLAERAVHLLRRCSMPRRPSVAAAKAAVRAAAPCRPADLERAARQHRWPRTIRRDARNAATEPRRRRRNASICVVMWISCRSSLAKSAWAPAACRAGGGAAPAPFERAGAPDFRQHRVDAGPMGSGAIEGARSRATGSALVSPGARPAVSCSSRALSLATVSVSGAPRGAGFAPGGPVNAWAPKVEASHSSTGTPARRAASRAAS